MQALLNRDEIVVILAKKILARSLKIRHQDTWPTVESYLIKTSKSFSKTGLFSLDFNVVNQCLRSDLQNSKDRFVADYKANLRPLVNWLADHYDQLGINDNYLIDLCVNSTQESFVKNFARQLDSDIEFFSSPNDIDVDAPVVLRNLLHNYKLVRELLLKKQNFWFMDSGYTNFVTGKKTWHRLVQNHIHHAVPDRAFPADRLHLLGSFPRPWRTNGTKILIIESSPDYYQMFDNSLESWSTYLGRQVRQYTDRYIEFRPKNSDRKTRDSLYQKLQASNDYYCVITDSSAAAVEAIWCGIPVITLGQHITNPVSRRNIADINNLYRGDIGNWLCALSYSQFTKQEMLDGTALRIIKEYYHV